MEDSLDVSAENLILLKEEAALIREDVLMRYISIFSELANQIRYSTNKRVLLEVAFIKLCRPQMQRDELSLAERIRRLEKKIEEGLVMAPPPSGGAGSMGANGVMKQPGPAGGMSPAAFDGVDAARRETPENGYSNGAINYQKAAPQDLQQIKTMWSSIIAGTSQRFRLVLASAELKFNLADGGGNQLFVVFADFLGETYLNDPARKEELEQLIAEKTGKKVEVRFILAADEGIQNASLKKIDVEEALKEFVHMDIEIEE